MKRIGLILKMIMEQLKSLSMYEWLVLLLWICLAYLIITGSCIYSKEYNKRQETFNSFYKKSIKGITKKNRDRYGDF